MGKLRDQMLADLQLCGAKPRTQETYLREAENLAKYFNRSPAELGEDELKEYLLYLMKERHLSEGTFRFYVAGLKFLYRTTLKREWPVEKIKHPKRRRETPGRSGSLGSGIPLFGHQKPQAQGDADDHVFIGTAGKRNSTSQDDRYR